MHRALASAALLALLPGCSSVSVPKVWPFDDKPATAGQSRGPANATEYQCNAGKRFYIRTLDNGNAVWLIYHDREVALNKTGTGTRYTNGIATFEINGGEASLTDGPAINYSGCKAAAAK